MKIKNPFIFYYDFTLNFSKLSYILIFGQKFTLAINLIGNLS